MNQNLHPENYELKGLSKEQAARRLKANGFNELPKSERKAAWKIAWQIISEPMILLLMACGTIYFFLGDIKESSILVGCIAIIIAITFYQEQKTEKALEALKDLSSPRALVIRDGIEERIAGREVVVDDLVILNEGDRVPADGILLSCSNLEVNESLLTGEFDPVPKSVGLDNQEMSRPGGNDSHCVYSGTLVVRGHGIFRVRQTGIKTEIGKIGQTLKEVAPSVTRLQVEIKKIVMVIASIGAVLCVLVAVIYALTRHDWLNGFLSGLALAMGILPEEFPLVLTIFLALGAWRISKFNVLTRNLPAVENLGSVNVLCVDKTGTLTHNKMEIKSVYAQETHLLAQGLENLPTNFNELVEYAHLASHKNSVEPMETAIDEFAQKYLNSENPEHRGWRLVNEYPLSKALLAVSHVWESDNGQDFIIASKGAPESIIELCHLKKDEAGKILEQVEVMAKNGWRVLGVAKAVFRGAILPSDHHDYDFEFLGLVGMADSIRSAVKNSLADCYRAGIRVIMITGDYAGTACNIAKQIGLKNHEQFITGQKLDVMSDEELREEIKTVNIFARVVPEQKLRLINALKANGELVAMTGDGVNDAPALKQADIGIAMGKKGTDVARESSDIVLLDDDFSSIVKGIKMGRTIFNNLAKAMAYILSIHIPIAAMSLIPVLFKWPLMLLPIHIVFMELVVDPACSLVFETAPAEKKTMDQPPRKLSQPLFSRQTIIFSAKQGVASLVVVLSVFLVGIFSGWAEEEVRAMTFATLVFANMGLIFINYSWSKTIIKSFQEYNLKFWSIQAMTLMFLLAALYIPSLRQVFRFSLLHINDLLVIFSITALFMLVLDRFKLARLKTVSNI